LEQLKVPREGVGIGKAWASAGEGKGGSCIVSFWGKIVSFSLFFKQKVGSCPGAWIGDVRLVAIICQYFPRDQKSFIFYLICTGKLVLHLFLGIDLALLSQANHSIMTYGTFGMWGSIKAGVDTTSLL
jgi:hypothetical protein